MVQIAFFAAPVLFGFVALLMSAVAATASADSGDVVYAYFWIMAAVCAALSVCLYQCFARFIPFAASTLQTALIAIAGHGAALYAVEMVLTTVLYAYTALWLLAFGGVVTTNSQKEPHECRTTNTNADYNEQYNDACDPISMPALMLFLVSLYWTQQVVQNLLHTTTAVSNCRFTKVSCLSCLNERNVTHAHLLKMIFTGSGWILVVFACHLQ